MTETQSALLQKAWDAFASALRTRHDPFRQAVLANTSTDGQPLARVVVVRAFDPQARLVLIHADHRSPKIGQFMDDPRAALCTYDAERQLQVRLHGKITVHHNDALALSRFAALASMSKLAYAETIGASIECAAPHQNTSTPLTDADAANNMAVLAFHFDSAEILELHHAGHQRLRVAFNPELRASWLTP